MLKYAYDIHTTVLVYPYLAHASRMALEQARVAKERSLYMASMLLDAFCLEAYLNYLGLTKVGFWDLVERRLAPREKLHLLLTLHHESVDMGSRPFETFRLIFRLRNQLVHAKPATLVESGEAEIADDEVPPRPETEWERLITPEIAQRFYDDTIAMIERLNRLLLRRKVDWSLQSSLYCMAPKSIEPTS